MEIEELWKNIKGEFKNLQKEIDEKLFAIEGRVNRELNAVEGRVNRELNAIEGRTNRELKATEERINQKLEKINLNMKKVIYEEIKTTQEEKIDKAIKQNEVEHKKFDARISELELKASGY